MALRRAGSTLSVSASPHRVLRAATTIPPARLRPTPAAPAALVAPAAAATSHSRTRTTDSSGVLSWVATAGGFVHEALAVVAVAPCGCRGVCATADIASDAPLIAVPEELTMSSQDALDLLTQRLLLLQHQEGSAAAVTAVTKQQLPHSAGGGGAAAATWQAPRGGLLQRLLQGLQQLQQQDQSPAQLVQKLTKVQPPMLLALLLAHQRQLGADSYWAPYIGDLPEEPPCLWYAAALPQVQAWDRQRQSEPSVPAVAASAADGASASAEAAAAAAAVAAKCTAAAAVFGRALGGLTAEELAWAYGHVVSRAFSTGRPQPDSMALLPAIDMLNHLAGASVPVFLEQQSSSEADGGSSDNDGDGASSGAWCIWPQQLTEWEVRGASDAQPAGGGQPGEGEEGGVVLRAGQELCISYASSCDAQTALSFGFCPAELKQA